LNSEPTTLLQGTLDLLILKSLATGEMHGLGISRRIQQITGGTLCWKRRKAIEVCHAAFCESQMFPAKSRF